MSFMLGGFATGLFGGLKDVYGLSELQANTRYKNAMSDRLELENKTTRQAIEDYNNRPQDGSSALPQGTSVAPSLGGATGGLPPLAQAKPPPPAPAAPPAPSALAAAGSTEPTFASENRSTEGPRRDGLSGRQGVDAGLAAHGAPRGVNQVMPPVPQTAPSAAPAPAQVAPTSPIQPQQLHYLPGQQNPGTGPGPGGQVAPGGGMTMNTSPIPSVVPNMASSTAGIGAALLAAMNPTAGASA